MPRDSAELLIRLLPNGALANLRKATLINLNTKANILPASARRMTYNEGD